MTAAAWVQAGATVVLVVLTLWYAYTTSKTLGESRRNAEATRDAAEASAKAAESAARQVALMERQQARREIEMMPLIWAKQTAFNSKNRTATVQVGNASGSAALEVTLRIYEGQLPGPAVTIRQPVSEDPHPQTEKLRYPTDGTTWAGSPKIEARYRDGLGNRWAVQCADTGETTYFRIVGGEDGGTPAFEPIASSAPLFPPQW